VVPLGLLGVVAAVRIQGMDNNIYTQNRHRADHRARQQERDP